MNTSYVYSAGSPAVGGAVDMGRQYFAAPAGLQLGVLRRPFVKGVREVPWRAEVAPSGMRRGLPILDPPRWRQYPSRRTSLSPRPFPQESSLAAVFLCLGLFAYFAVVGYAAVVTL